MCIQYIECHVADFASLSTNFWQELSSAELQICCDHAHMQAVALAFVV